MDDEFPSLFEADDRISLFADEADVPVGDEEESDETIGNPGFPAVPLPGGFLGSHPFANLAALDQLETRDAIRFEFRSLMAALAESIVDRRIPAPLDGLDPVALERCVGLALSVGCFDSLDFLSPDRAWPAVYVVAAALPNGHIRKMLGKGVAAALKSSDTATFVSLAIELVLSSSSRWAKSRAVRARVALALERFRDVDPRTDALALALVSRSELVNDWLVTPSTGSLGSRRLSARLLERASREAVRRHASGDESGVRIFETASVAQAFERLLRDRESLVWRHVAIARGHLTLGRPVAIESILLGLDPSLGIGEWRRAAVSLAAAAHVSPDLALSECERLLESELATTDPGLSAELVHGLAPVIPADPERIVAIIGATLDETHVDAIEALSECRSMYAELDVVHELDARANAALAAIVLDNDEGRTALVGQLRETFDPNRSVLHLDENLDVVRASFAENGSSAPLEPLAELVDRIRSDIIALDELDHGDPETRIRAGILLRDVDRVVLETESLFAVVSTIDDAAIASEMTAALVECLTRLANYLLAHEGREALEPTPNDTFARIRRVRTLLHLLDLDRDVLEGMGHTIANVRRVASTIVFERVRDDSSRIHRALTAAASRVLDARIRDDELDIVDVVHLATAYAFRTDDLRTLGEASMVPDVSHVLTALADSYGSRDSSSGAASAIVRLANALPVASSTRVDALRLASLRVASATRVLATVQSLSDLAKPDFHREARTLVDSVGQILLGAAASARRASFDPTELYVASASIVELPYRIARVAAGLDPPETLARHAESAVARAALPFPIANALVATVGRIAKLPFEATPGPHVRFSVAPTPASLPAWVPLHRTIGDFVVERALGGGSLGSVFVARRRGERLDPDAERVALKVPDYDATNARLVSQQRFVEMFRDEAGALLSVPHHPNLARFITFDVGARPKPILVMELVHGPSLERSLETNRFSWAEALDVLDGLAAGLEAMHAVGVGHLDLKPSNIILREETGTPVLVDFGLAGRRVRPGCGTPHYGAAEVWFGAANEFIAAPPADVYAFGCLAYELLFDAVLFDADDVMELVTLHAMHDGWPMPLVELVEHDDTRPVAELIASCLRRDPGDRATISETRAALDRFRQSLGSRSGPQTREDVGTSQHTTMVRPSAIRTRRLCVTQSLPDAMLTYDRET